MNRTFSACVALAAALSLIGLARADGVRAGDIAVPARSGDEAAMQREADLAPEPISEAPDLAAWMQRETAMKERSDREAARMMENQKDCKAAAYSAKQQGDEVTITATAPSSSRRIALKQQPGANPPYFSLVCTEGAPASGEPTMTAAATFTSAARVQAIEIADGADSREIAVAWIEPPVEEPKAPEEAPEAPKAGEAPSGV